MRSRISRMANLSNIYTNHCIQATAKQHWVILASRPGISWQYPVIATKQVPEVTFLIQQLYKSARCQKLWVTWQQKWLKMLNPRPIDVNGLNDGFDDALCLSLSWTEKVIQSIVEFESELDKNPSNQGVLPMPVDNLSAPMNQEVSITNKSNVNIATNNTLPPVFNFNSCNIQFYNVSKWPVFLLNMFYRNNWTKCWSF